MSYGDFPKQLYIKTIDTSEDVLLGGFKITNSMELKYVMLHIYIDGAIPTAETMQLEFHADSLCGSLLFSSNIINISDIPNVTSRHLAVIRFDFNRENLSKEYYYYPKLKLTNYTRGAMYLGVLYDWPDYTYPNSNVNPFTHCLKTELIGYML